MNCPSCNQPAASFLRYAFTLQGVPLYQSMRGYFKCEHCGALLHVKSFGRYFWYCFVGSILVLALFTLFYRSLIKMAGTNLAIVVWFLILAGILVTFVLGMWKYAVAEKVESDDLV